MNKLMKKMAVALTVGTMAITATGVVAHAGMDGYWDKENEYDEECESSVITPDLYEYTTRIVSVPSGYLALRTSPCWTDDDSNVLEEMYSGEVFTITDYSDNGQYAYGFSHTTGTWGWVNDSYLIMPW